MSNQWRKWLNKSTRGGGNFGDRRGQYTRLEQDERQTFDQIKHLSHNLENTDPVTLADYVNRVTKNTQYLTEQEYNEKFGVYHQKAIKELQDTNYVNDLLSPVRKMLSGKDTSIDTFRNMWENIKDRQQNIDRILAEVDRGIEASYKLVQNKFQEQPDLLKDLHAKYQEAYQNALNFGIQEKVKNVQHYGDLVTAVNQYINLSTKIKEAEDKVLAKLNQTEDDLWNEVKDQKNAKYLTDVQKMRLRDRPNIVIIKEMRNDIYERKQRMDNTLATINDRIQTPKEWLQKTFEKRPDISKELQEECKKAYQNALVEKNKIKTLIDQVKHYDDLKQRISQSEENLFSAIDELEQAQLKVLKLTDKQWAQGIQNKERTISDLIKGQDSPHNVGITKKLEQLQKIVDKGQKKEDHTFNHNFINARDKALDLGPRSEKELRLAYVAEEQALEEFDPITLRKTSLKTLDQLIGELQQLDTDLDELLKVTARG